MDFSHQRRDLHLGCVSERTKDKGERIKDKGNNVHPRPARAGHPRRDWSLYTLDTGGWFKGRFASDEDKIVL